jgi:hypothetical protein
LTLVEIAPYPCFQPIKRRTITGRLNFFTAPITLQATWYAPYGYLVLAMFAAIVLYAFRFSFDSRPLFAPSRLDE